MGDIGHGDDNGSIGCHDRYDILEHSPGVHQMLKHVEEEHEIRGAHIRQLGVEIDNMDFIAI